MNDMKVLDDLFLFRSGAPGAPINFNQYLLLGSKPLLAHTGSHATAVELIPRLEEYLKGKDLSYIFISHFESDECGGLSLLMDRYPNAVVICSAITDRQLKGFGLNYNTIVKSAGDVLEEEDYTLQFISYPSEMHLWEGLLLLETKRQILFSSDLCIHMDNINEFETTSNIEDEIKRITLMQIPSPTACEAVQKKLTELPIKNIATGHGPFVRL